MFVDLMEKGHSPIHPDYNEWVYNWLESNILEEKPCGWLEEYSNYFCNSVNNLMAKEKIYYCTEIMPEVNCDWTSLVQVIQCKDGNNLCLSLLQNEKIFQENSNGKSCYLCHDGFFNKIIDTFVTFDHICPKCKTGIIHSTCSETAEYRSTCFT